MVGPMVERMVLLKEAKPVATTEMKQVGQKVGSWAATMVAR